MKVFYNVSNHPHDKWSEEQLKAAYDMGAEVIIDLPFPNVPADMVDRSIRAIGADIAGTIVGELNRGNEVVGAMVQGEFTMTYAIVNSLIYNGITVYAATSERISIDNDDGSKTVKFNFNHFRKYTEIGQKFTI